MSLSLTCVCAKSLQSYLTLCNPMDYSPDLQASLPMGFSRQEYWSGLSCPPPGDLPNPGIEPSSLASPALAGRFFIISATWEIHLFLPLYTQNLCTFCSLDGHLSAVTSALVPWISLSPLTVHSPLQQLEAAYKQKSDHILRLTGASMTSTFTCK